MAYRFGRKMNTQCMLYTLIALIILWIFYIGLLPCYPVDDGIKFVPNAQYMYLADNTSIQYDRNLPLVFVGGFPRSGTTLMRAILDAHPEVRCGEETRIIPRLLGMQNNWKRSPIEAKRLLNAGITEDVIDSAMAAFILEVIVKHGEPAKRLCNKDPFALKSMMYLAKLFPQGKFIFMIRDGRAVVHSIMSRQVSISGFNLSDPKSCLEKWSKAVETMHSQCIHIGPSKCLPVYYEELVLHPRTSLKGITRFLNLPWNDALLHHEEYVGKPGGISLSKVEKSTDQVVRPVNVDALTKWVGKFPKEVIDSMNQLAPMLNQLGYDPRANPPNYGKPDDEVILKTKQAQNQEEGKYRQNSQKSMR
ncbi:protein-tyrosine sulfotransferase 1 [Lingula anatina]|uniref:Protein-tyrosine sulfotransferase n=1 Tax=Lingula anatina TaxID=7574 RepID=A0A1S3HCQ2_LINAN|nr:protein-tyrosine sulfotransferase 1 [Lingula anatina]|eukprot:XP_013383306.1 protein-tyrosine sulfotransferase 1 [Lingula anatina]